MNNFWAQLETKKITDREAIEEHLTKKLGKPTNQLSTNCLEELTKKINSYYTEPEEQNHTTYSLIGSVSEISQKKYKEGKHKGQIYYVLKLANQETLQARQENLAKDKWQQIEQSALLGQNLVFQYRKWFSNKQILGWYLATKTSKN